MFNNICELCPKFKDLPNEAKFIWLFTNEDISVLKIILETKLNVWQAVLSKIFFFYVFYSRGVEMFVFTVTIP
jgi:hypothetical protein